ncbi:MAG: hypothetical protein AB7S39_23750 [Gemmatimonadales bacterium]
MLHSTLTIAALLVSLGSPGGPDPAQLPEVRALVDQLNTGHLVLPDARFPAGGDQPDPAAQALLRQVARAINQSGGRFVVFVPAERQPTEPPDTVLSRRRTTGAYRALLGAGSNPRHLVGTAGPEVLPHPEAAIVGAGEARVELFRVRR